MAEYTRVDSEHIFSLRPNRPSGCYNYLRRRGIRFTIPRLSNERRSGPFSREIYRQRNVVERAINRLKQFRRIATRYEKLAANYTAMITIASILLWL